MAKISVVVPVYNVEKVLPYCINSIINQKMADFELILVNDGSVDNSAGICDEYAKKDNRIKVIHNSNSGPSNARNTGIKIAKGKYICFVDSDDFVDDDYLQNLLEAKEIYQDYDNIWCGFQIVEDYKKSNPNVIVESESKDKSFFQIKDYMYLHEKWLNASPWNKLYSLDIIKNNNIYFCEDLCLGEDLLFNLQYIDYTNKNILVLNNSPYNYVCNGTESLDHKYYDDLFSIYKLINKEMLEYFDKWCLSDEQKVKAYAAAFYKYLSVLKNTFNKKNKRSLLNKIKYNNEILSSQEFIECVEIMNDMIHPLYRFAYKSKNYILVVAVDILVGLKSKFSKN